jgi:hypothetical protein
MMSASNSNDDIHTQLGEIKGKLEGIDENVYELKKDIRGNGQKGILERLTRTEEGLAALVEATNTTNNNSVEDRKATTLAINELTKSVANLQSLMTTHVSDKKSHTLYMFLTKTNMAISVGVFVFLHSIFPPLTLQGIANMVLQFLGLPVIK